jgi:hypothetical protein
MELRSATTVSAECLKAFDLTGGPLRIEARVQYSHAGGWWYLGNFINVRMGDDHILIRVDNASQIRLENNWTAASGYTQPICDYQAITPNVPHVITLDVDPVRYRLFVDDRLLSEGEHEVEPVPAVTLELSMGSGHQGHGDVAWVDYVRVSRLEGW